MSYACLTWKNLHFSHTVNTVTLLILYSLETHFNTTTTDCFWKHCNEQFLLFPQWFLLKQIIVSPFDIISWFGAELEEPKGLKSLLQNIRRKKRGKQALSFYFIDTQFDSSTTAVENNVGKREIARNEQFLR